MPKDNRFHLIAGVRSPSDPLLSHTQKGTKMTREEYYSQQKALLKESVYGFQIRISDHVGTGTNWMTIHTKENLDKIFEIINDDDKQFMEGIAKSL
jgi:hypothetical protein